MKRQGAGSIINTASVAGLRAGFAVDVYSAAKAGVVHLITSAAMELGECGVRVNSICPGGVVTPFFGRALGFPEEPAGSSEGLAPVLEGLQPLRRPCRPEEVAQAALWLAIDASSFVNGHALVVDGGMIGGRLWSAYQEAWARLRSALEGGGQ